MTPPPRKPTPPAMDAIPEDEDWETSDVHASPPQPPARAATQPGRTAPAGGYSHSDGRATARKALAKIDELGRRFEDHREEISRSIEKHAREDHEQFTKIDAKLDGQNAKLDGQNEVLAKLRESSATSTATLAGLTSELRLAREKEVRMQLKEREAELADQVDTKAHERKVKFEWGRIVPVVITAIVTALIAAVATGKVP